MSGWADLAARRKLLLNLANVQAMSSAMVDQIVAFSKRVQAKHGQLVLCNIQPGVAPVIQHLRLGRVLTIRRDTHDGREAFR